jgi:hypothetical protein
MRKGDTPSLGGWCVELKTVPFGNVFVLQQLTGAPVPNETSAVPLGTGK